MNRTLQISLSAALVAGAAVATFLLTREPPTPGTMADEGHDHAAMMAGMEEAQPVRLTEADGRRIGVTLAAAETKVLPVVVEAVGVATYDETRLRVVNPKLEGWVESLHVDFNGAPVRRGDPLMDIYAPQLVSAQEELALAATLARESGSDRGRENAQTLLESARRRLAYWDIPAATIRRLEETGEVRRSVTIPSPATGIVVEKNVVEGDRITPGMTLYRIADLSRVWVEVDVFEQDLGRVRVGQPATVRFEAFPAEPFEARITYIYPTVSLESRTGRVRLELENPQGRLRPGMYARVSLTGETGPATVVVPRSALLETGERAVVFVEDRDGSLIPRAVSPGRVAGREVQILAGIRAGERIVTSAAFLVDAESNLGSLLESGGMPGMEMDGMDDSTGMDGTDPSQHDMSTSDAMDHSEHEMSAPDAMDPSQHDMASPDAMDHSGHTTPVRDTTRAGG